MSSQSLLNWFLRLRWFAFFGQFLVLLVSVFFVRTTLPVVPVVALLCTIPVSNFLCRSRLAQSVPEKGLLSGLLVFDTLVLTAILYFSGGPTNPFSIVYLLHVVLAAVMLGEGWSWGVAALSFSCFLGLFWSHVPVPEWHMHGEHQGFSVHLHGMLFAFAVVSILAAYFLSRIVRELRRAERRLEQLENVSQNAQRLTAIAALTAHAAHELGSPLGTIHMVAHELGRNLDRQHSSPSIQEDLTILKSEADRCQAILAELAMRTGDSMGESICCIETRAFLEDLRLEVGAEAGRVRISVKGQPQSFFGPINSLRAALGGLLHNALEASALNAAEVELACYLDANKIEFEIVDRGIGLSDELMARIGEPFFSTKGKEGMGLGVYAARLTAQQLGGELNFERHESRGTRVRFVFPRLQGVVREAA